MSTQKGNVTRTRPQKYRNKTKFKNDLHDKTPQMKLVNSLEIDNVCVRCKDIIQWKIKFKKYKPLKNPATCVKCHNKSIKHAYHTLCGDCSKTSNVCPKCQMAKEFVTAENMKSSEELLKSSSIQGALKSLSERRRRTLFRHFNKPSFSLTTEDEILNKIKDMSVSSVGRDDLVDEFSDDLSDLEFSENEDN